MHFLYNIAIRSTETLLPLAGRYSEKLRSFSRGRKGLFEHLSSEISSTDKTIWFHAASLGEYEQAVPVILAVRDNFPSHKIVVSFFSPSGYEVKKNTSLADVVTYLPLDTKENAAKFIELVHPEWALFIKYEFWPNFLNELHKKKVRTLLISGVFRKDQMFFKPYGKWMRQYLKSFEFFFLQDNRSETLLKKLGYTNCAVSGDTRFDRVNAQPKQDNHLDFVEEFLGGDLCVVAGSTWPEDEDLLLDIFNRKKEGIKFIIAPHAIRPEKIKALQEKLRQGSVLYSERGEKQLKDYKILIIDTVGLLTKIYSYANIAYVGGAAGQTGLHNILEPAAFGVPVIIGKNYSKFPEAAKLREAGGLFSVENKAETEKIFNKLILDADFRKRTGAKSEAFILKNKGATEMISKFLLKNQ